MSLRVIIAAGLGLVATATFFVSVFIIVFANLLGLQLHNLSAGITCLLISVGLFVIALRAVGMISDADMTALMNMVRKVQDERDTSTPKKNKKTSNRSPSKKIDSDSKV